MANKKAFSVPYPGNDNFEFLPMLKVYNAIMTAYRWETDEESERFHNGTFEIGFTDGDGNKTSFECPTCPYIFEAVTDALEEVAERINDECAISDWLYKLFLDVKAGNETFICK